MNFPTKLKNLRKSKGYDQRKFGEILGLSQQSVSDLENGKKNPSKTLIAYLKYRYSDIFGEKGVTQQQRIKMNTIDNPFRDKTRANRIIQQLVHLEQADLTKYSRAEGYIDALANTTPAATGPASTLFDKQGTPIINQKNKIKNYGELK